MSRFIQGPNTFTVATAAKAIVAGRFYLVDGFFGLAVQDADPAQGLHRLNINLNAEPGVYEVSAVQVTAADAFNVKGADVYFDGVTEKLTTVAAGNRWVGLLTAVKDGGGVIEFYLAPQVAAGAGFKRAAAQIDVAAVNAAPSAGAPTKIEFDAVVTLANDSKATLNGLLAKLRVAGILS